MRKFASLNTFFFYFLLIGVGINIGQFFFIEKAQSPNYRALNRLPPGNTSIELSTSQSSTMRGYYLPWYTLSKVAPDSTIIIPPSSQDLGLFNNDAILGRLSAFGGIKGVKNRAIKTPLNVSELINKTAGCVVASGENGKIDLPYFAIIMDISECPERRLANQRGLYLSTKLPVESNREFLLVPWEGPGKPFLPSGKVTPLAERPAKYYALLIETSLLPQTLLESER